MTNLKIVPASVDDILGELKRVQNRATALEHALRTLLDSGRIDWRASGNAWILPAIRREELLLMLDVNKEPK